MLAATARQLKPTDRVLEIGCGAGSTAIRLAPYAGSWMATDFSAEMLRIAEAKPAPKNLRFVLADAENAFDGGPFDAICAFQILHLVDDLPGLLSRIHAHLKPGGLLLLQGYRPEQVAYRTGGPSQVENLYTRQLLEAAFADFTCAIKCHDAEIHEGVAMAACPR
ncbi:cyclopropane fatty-acyl-phospholipid synthase-like methyltransferase [Rhodoblastus sphagnicola]|uniref:class I SAM-dependent methyltransferase n=1 Tax=Rhodoblastus sphagnicola TaxID=333368 RepID=UPI00180582B6|nr:cyclopropane fatty-acyl-phospholipid synthase-like methyltransferase [Rhodoblastus sphagnicola]